MADLPPADHVAFGDVRKPLLLEHPEEAFTYYRRAGIGHVVCEEKHMGSRAVVIACRDADAARRRFGVENATGIIYTRTAGRSLPTRLSRRRCSTGCAALGGAGFWDRFETAWVCLDAELMPWSAKAQALLADQYAPVGAAARAGFAEAEALLARTAARSVDVAALAQRTSARAAAARASPTPTAATAGRSARWTTSGWRRSTCWRPRAAPMSTGTMPGIWKRSTRSPRPARRSRRRLGARLTS